MNFHKFFSLIFIILFFVSCSKKIEKDDALKERSLDLQMIEAYKEGMSSLESGDVLFAAKKFNEAEILYPQSIWAPRAALMAAYSYYFQDYYGDAVAELERFIKVYPKHENLDYAYFLLATTHYEQIVNEKKDLGSLLDAKKNFLFVMKNFPKTDYAIDAKFKLDLIDDTLASKEMYIGRYYLQQKKWIAAINRFRTVVDEYETTIYIEEALHRLVEIYYFIGLSDEAQKYANLLGYNFQSSEWYEKTYSVFDKNYEKNNKIIKNKAKNSRKLIKKIKSLFE